MSSVPILGGTLSITESATIGRNLTVGGTISCSRPLSFELSSLLLKNNIVGYTQSNLNYYEEYAARVNSTGAWTASYTLQITRVGKQVTLQVLVDPVEDATAAESLLRITIPYRFCPGGDLYFKVPGKENGAIAQLNGITTIDSPTELFALDIGYPTSVYGVTVFTADAAAHIKSFSINYNVAIPLS